MQKPLTFWQIALIAPLIFTAGWFGGNMAGAQERVITNVALRENNIKYTFTNPLLLCDTSVPPHIKAEQDIKTAVTSFLDTQKAKGAVKRGSVYFRDLNQGHWFGVNEDSSYSPASLLKVPTLIAFFKYAEENPDSLNKKIYFGGGFDDNKAESITPRRAIVPGNSYTVRELLDYMIKYSDNNATRLLDTAIDSNYTDRVFTDLGITRPTLNAPIDFMSVKNYSYFFRILFNASYLNRTMSEKALTLLSVSDFQQGITGGVPSTIAVAHKFGERVVYFQNNTKPMTKELHDCGIVYYPNRPYMLCVMTEGDDLTTLAQVIRAISATVYAQVKKHDRVWP